jgi:slime mold repeat-containing protein/EGF domain-containing protein
MRLVSPWILIAVLVSFAGAVGCGSSGETPGRDAGVDSGGDCPADQHPDGAGSCTSDPCVPSPCTAPHQSQCVAEGDGAVCHCDPGTHDDGSGCAVDDMCTDTTCGGHGTCSDADGSLVCACDPGFSGAFCAGCDAAGGYISDGKGGCTKTPCEPNPCPQGMSICAVESGIVVCHCDAGTHEQNGACVPDVTCLPTTCAGHGACSEVNGALVCACEPGWAAPSCGACDDVLGYHADGMGGCTKDLCLPSPCTDAHKSVCSVPVDTPICACDPGYHDAAGACVTDEVCTPATCGGHGTCSVTGGIAACACDAGYVGPTCTACNTLMGYHPDGMGDCTADPCMPNPCSGANQTTCTVNGTLAVCGCDAGYHADGQGGCTSDPCTPNPCAAMNQACKNNGGQAQCFVPACDDANPCTTDVLSNGVCSHTPLAAGSACSTTLCLTGQTCQAGACTGGAATSCNDGNPCTTDSCQALTGCAHAVDNSIVPGDAVGCTVDSCVNGAPVHTPSNAACDDGLYCTGTEACSPGSPGANAQGCVTSNVPVPPAPSGPCVTYGACAEATHTFPAVNKPVGAACNDGIPCTQGDTCNAIGSCAGVPVAGCDPTATCTTVSSLPGTIDIPVATITGSVTMGGQPLPPTNPFSYTSTIYLRSKDTGASHALAYFSYSNNLSGPYFTSRLLPGIYDVLYRRNWDSVYNTVSSTVSTDLVPNGYRQLQANLVVGTGANNIAVDIPVATVTGTVTMGGQPLPATNPFSYTSSIYLRSKDTGAYHSLAYFSYSSNLSGPYFTSRLLPGTYDMVYRRNWDSVYNTVSSTVSTDLIPNGYRLLTQNVVVQPGANNIAVDIPLATVTGTVTMGGQPLPATNPFSYTSSIYLRSQDTGAYHSLAYFSYSNNLSGPYFTSRLLPGTYDMVYRRNWDSVYNTVSSTVSTDLIPNGYRVLATGISVTPGANNIAVDIPLATVTGTVTMGGQPLPATNPFSYTSSIYLRSKDTGAYHSLAYFSYSNNLSGPYFTSRLLPGTYDMVYRRNWDSVYNTVSSTVSTDLIPNGYRVLAQNVVVQPGANNIAVDIPVATVTGTVTMGGQPLPATNPFSYTTTLYLRAQDTGAYHGLAYFSYSSNLSGPYFTSRLLPGAYDLVYRRNWDSVYNTVSSTVSTDLIPNGYRVLSTNIVIQAGANNVAVDIPVVPIGGSVTLGGQALPATNPFSYTSTLYLQARDTGAAHTLAYFSYSNNLSGPYFTARLLPGTYDLLYRRNWDSTYDTVSSTVSTDLIPNGYRLLGTCLTVP